MNVKEHIQNFSALGEKLKFIAENSNKESFLQASNQNPWFTHQFIKDSLLGLSFMLSPEKLTKWVSNYKFNSSTKTVGVVLAGNIPLVGFHDILSIIISGHKAKIKLSSKDQWLYQLIFEELYSIEPAYKDNVEWANEALKDIDAIIATGSDNTARYFDYYFSKYPNIIRKNRNSIAILSGDESDEELQLLAHDIFMYFGLGCRNVSQIFMPKEFSIERLIKAFDGYENFNQHTKYYNNYEYQKTIHLLNQMPHYDNGFVIFKEDVALTSPIGVLNYSYYKSVEELNNFQKVNKHKIQCIVSKTKMPFSTYCLGEAQKPELWDYADGIDTLQFLSQLN